MRNVVGYDLADYTRAWLASPIDTDVGDSVCGRQSERRMTALLKPLKGALRRGGKGFENCKENGIKVDRREG